MSVINTNATKHNMSGSVNGFMTSAASASVGLIEKVNEAASTKLDQASSAVMDFFDFGDIKKVEQTGEFVLTEEMLERGLTEEEYLRVVEIKKKENRDLATYIDSIQEGLEADKKIIDSIYDEYNQTMYDWDLYVNRYDSNVRDLYNHIKHGYPDYEMLKEYGLSVEDGNLTFEKFCEKSHKGDAYIEYLNIRNDYIEEQFNRLEATKGFKYQDYEKFLEIKKNNLTNLEILRGTEKNNDNEYAQMEYNLLTLLEDFKNTKDLDKLIENPIGDEKYVNELGGQYLEIYNYLKKTDSKKASEYLLAIEDPINQLKGTEKAMQRIALLSKDSDGNIEDALLNEIMVAVTGFNDGVYDFGEGLCKIIDDDMTVQDYEVMVYMSYLTSMQSNIYSTFQSAGNMVIPMSVSTAISILAPETSPLILSGISSTLIGGSSYGQTKAQMLYEGYDRKKAMAYAAWSATSDAVLEAALGGIENIGISTMLDGAGKLTLRKFAVKQLREMVQEGGEEVIQDLFKSAVIDDIVLGKEFNFDEFSEGAAKTFFQSALVAGLLNGGKSTINLVVHNTQITLNEEDLQDILQRSNNGEDINDIVSAVLARKVNGGNSSVIESIDNSTNTQDNASNITPNGENINDVVNEVVSNRSALEDAGNMLSSNINKYKYQDTSSIEGLNESIKNNGLYHFTNDVSKILQKGYLKASDMIASYGNRKSFMFNGIPTVGAFVTNLDTLPLTATAVKIDPSDSLVNSGALKVRYADDQAISYDGNLNLDGLNPEGAYFVLVKEGDNLFYKEVSKMAYDTYPNTEAGQEVQAFIADKNNINKIKSDFYAELKQNSKKQSSINKISNIYEKGHDINKAFEYAQKNGNIEAFKEYIKDTPLEQEFCLLTQKKDADAATIALRTQIANEIIDKRIGKEFADKVRSLSDNIGKTNYMLYNIGVNPNVDQQAMMEAVDRIIELQSNPDLLIGIHRMGSFATLDGAYDTFFDSGLALTGHSSSGAFSNVTDNTGSNLINDLGKNISFLAEYGDEIFNATDSTVSIEGLISEIACGGHYKNHGNENGGVVIFAIPKSELNNPNNDIIIKDGVQQYVNPKYIDGIVDVNNSYNSIEGYNQNYKIEIKKAQETLKNYTDKLFNPAEALNDNSGKYKVTYKDYNGKQVPIINVTGEFDMLVHGVPIKNYVQTGTAKIVEQLADNPQIWMDMNRPGANFISVSNISDVKSKFMQRQNLVLGFSNIAEDQISKVCPSDNRTPMIKSPIKQRKLQYDTFEHIKGLSDKNKLQNECLSEIVMNRYIKDKNGELTKYPPNYLLITDGIINDATLKWADYFGIPLVNIDSKIYAREGLNGVQKLINDMPLDNYVLSEQRLGELINYANKTTWYNYTGFEYNVYDLIRDNIGEDGTLTMTPELKNQLLYAVDHHLKYLEGTNYQDIMHKDYKLALEFDKLSSKKIGDLNEEEFANLLHDQNFNDIYSEICQDIVDLGYDCYCDSQGLHIYGKTNDINNLKLPGLKPVFDEALCVEVINIPFDQNASMIDNIHNIRSILTKPSNNSSVSGLDNSTKSYLNEISGNDSLSEFQKNSIDSSLESLSWKIGADSIGDLTSVGANAIAPIVVSELVSDNSLFKKEYKIKEVYKDYDYVYKVDNNLNEVIEQVKKDNLDGNILIELDRFDSLSVESINSLPDGVNVRVVGAYDDGTLNSFSSPSSAENSARNTIYTKAELLAINEQLEKIDSGFDWTWTDREKVEYFYKYLRDNIPYNPNPSNRSAMYEGLIGLIAEESTCQGFAHIFDELCYKYGVECKQMVGTFGSSGGHSYNVVTIDGKQYVVDCVREHLDGKSGCLTSGDEISNYTARGANKGLLEAAQSDLGISIVKNGYAVSHIDMSPKSLEIIKSLLIGRSSVSDILINKLDSYINDNVNEFKPYELHDFLDSICFADELNLKIPLDKISDNYFKSYYDKYVNALNKMASIRGFSNNTFEKNNSGYIDSLFSGSGMELSNFLNASLNLNNALKEYQKARDYIHAKEDIISSLQSYKNSDEIASFESKFNSLLEKGDFDSIDEYLKYCQQDILDHWSQTVNHVENYVEGNPFKFLCHSTGSTDWNGDYCTRFVSTSLLTDNLTDTYRLGYGFIFNPENIVGAASKDTYTNNNANGIDELLRYTLVPKIDTPEKLIKECFDTKSKNPNDNVYNEVIIDGFNPAGIFCIIDGTYKGENNYQDALKLQKKFPDLKVIRIPRNNSVDLDLGDKMVSDAVDNNVSSDEEVKLIPIEDNTIITYNNGLENKSMSYSDIKYVVDNLLDDNGWLIDNNFNDSNNYFYKNSTTPNEVATAVLNMLKNYEIDDKDFSLKCRRFVVSYYSSLDQNAVHFEDYIRNSLAKELFDAYGSNLKMTQEQINDLHLENLVNFISSDDMGTVTGDFGTTGLANGYKCIVNYDAFDKFREDAKQHLIDLANGKLSASEIADNVVQDYIFHEILHLLSSKNNGKLSGFSTTIGNSSTHNGINEAVTEYMAERRPESLYNKIGAQFCSYQEGVIFIRDMIRNNAITEYSLFKYYFNNDVNGLSSELNMRGRVPATSGLDYRTKPFEVFTEVMDILTNPGSAIFSRERFKEILYKTFRMEKEYLKKKGR